MDYGNILSRAWRITWNNKILWVFGFLAGLGSGGGGNGNARFSTDGQPGGTPFPPDLQRQLERPEVLSIVLAVICVLLIIGIVFFILSIIGRGGLIGGIRQAEDKGAITFGEGWSIGTHYFWRMLGIQLILFLVGLVIGGFGVAGAFVLGPLAACLLPVLCILIIALIPLAIVAHFAQFGVVLEELPVTAAFGRAWELIKANWGPILILGIIMFVINLVAGLVLVAPFVAVAFPAIAAFTTNPENPNLGLVGATGLGLLCLLPFAIVIGSLLTTWTYSVWTLAYRQFIGAPAAPSTPPPAPYQPA
jgi:hypothetical protein